MKGSFHLWAFKDSEFEGSDFKIFVKESLLIDGVEGAHGFNGLEKHGADEIVVEEIFIHDVDLNFIGDG